MSGKRLRLSILVSTNMHTTELLSQSGIEPWTIVSADYQSGGKGQRGRVWESEAGENLTFSVLLKPKIGVSNQYLISAAVSLALVEALDHYGCDALIKWPNDIIVNNHKIAGLLIENQLKGDRIEYSIVGIGLNVNQVHFSQFRWPATSIKLENGRQLSYSRDDLLEVVVDLIKLRLNEAESSGSKIMNQLNERLYKRGELVSFDRNGESIQGVIREVTADGHLMLSEKEGVRAYSNGKITFRNTFG